MKYELSGRLILEAADIEDACRKLSEHFALLAEGENSHIPKPGTDIKLKRVGVKTPVPPKVPSRPPRRG